MSVVNLSEGAVHDMRLCFALVNMSALALKQIGDSPEEAQSAVRQMREVMGLAKAFSDQALNELEVISRKAEKA